MSQGEEKTFQNICSCISKWWVVLAPLGKGHKDQVLGGDLPVLPAHLRRNLSSIIFWGEASLKDQVLKIMLVQTQTEDRVQGICRHWGLQWTCWPGAQHWEKIDTTFQGAIIWPSPILSPCGKATGATRSANHTPPPERWTTSVVQCWWASSLPTGAPVPSAQEAVADDQYPQQLF